MHFVQRAELHAWIFTNIRSKWSGLRRRALSAIPSTADKNSLILERLCDLLSGYHTTRHTVITSLQRAGIAINSLCDSSVGIVSWNASKLHSLVGHFLRVRFPVLLALNKCDIKSSSKFYQSIREELPGEPMVRTSACIEWWLQQNSTRIQVQDQHSVVAVSEEGDVPLL
jgi:ribosome-binding ATPase YchF (GTP1/OBG family)